MHCLGTRFEGPCRIVEGALDPAAREAHHVNAVLT